MIKKNVTKFLAFPKKELMQQSFNKVVGKWSEKHGIYLSRGFKDDLLQFYFKGCCQKSPPTSFSSVTFKNLRISPKNFLTFSFNPFATLV